MNNFPTQNRVIMFQYTIIILCSIVFLSLCSCTASKPSHAPEISAKDFYSLITEDGNDVETVLGQSKNAIAFLLMQHPQQFRIQVPLHERKRLIALTHEEEKKLGESEVQKLASKNIIYQPKQDMDRIGEIARRITDVLPTSVSHRIFLANTAAVNVFCLTDGTLIVTKGALDSLRDDELAFFIARGYGHAVACHNSETFTQIMVANVMGKNALSRMIKNVGQAENMEKKLLADIGYHGNSNLGILLQYNKTMENEADVLGIVYMKKAGYEVDNALASMKRLDALSPEDPSWQKLLVTHTASQKHIECLKKIAGFNSGEVFTQVSSEDEDITLDWTDETIELLEKITLEQRDCENAVGEVLFIPGLFNYIKKAESYLPKLAEVYPNHKLTVVQWKAMSEMSWKRAVSRANFMSDYLSLLLRTRRQDELDRLVLMGHSLGGQVIIGAAPALAQSGVKVGQIILLASAVHYDTDELKSCVEVSIAPPMNLFNPFDRILKHPFLDAEHVPALGLLGAKTSIHGLMEYRVPFNDNPKNVIDTFESHKVQYYLDGLAKILQGAIPCEQIKIDHHTIETPIKFMPFAIPEIKGRVHESYCDWQFVSYVLPKLTLPKGGKKSDQSLQPEPKQPDRILYVILNPYGECCGWALNEDTASAQFKRIKAKLDAQIKASRN